MRFPGRLFLALLVGYAAYALIFVERTSFILDGVRHFVLFDDAMVSMRYALHFSSGLGLVWNAGAPPVEGFSNPLWVAMMAAIHQIPLSRAKISLVVQLAAIAFRLADIVLARALALRLLPEGSKGYANLAAALTAFYYPLNFWGIEGMEVAALAPLITLAALLAAGTPPDSARKGERLWRTAFPYLLLAAGTLIRLDMAVPYLVVLAWRLTTGHHPRKLEAIAGISILVGALGFQSIARYAYYGEWMPNTYYLKMTGYPVILRIAHGVSMVWAFFQSLYWIPLPVCAWAVATARSNPLRGLLTLLFLGQCAYAAYVGGDAWESELRGSNRFVSVAMPVFFALCADFAAGAGQAAARRLGSAPAFRSRHVLLLSPLLACSLFILVILADHRVYMTSRPLYWDINRRYVQVAYALDDMLRDFPQARVAVTSAGVLPYFLDRQCIDMLGKNDKRIARMAVQRHRRHGDWPRFHAGHMKWDNAYSIGVLRPEVVVAPWTRDKSDLEALDAHYSLFTIAQMPVCIRSNFLPAVKDQLPGR